MTEHTVDYSDENGRWECSCGYVARSGRIAPVHRHARAANATEREAQR